MHPRLWSLFLVTAIIATAIVTPVIGFAVGSAISAGLDLTGIPATIVVTFAIVIAGAVGVKTALWLSSLSRSRT